MPTTLEKALSRIAAQGLEPTFAKLQRGIEKESLRVAPTGKMAQTPHPAALGSALTHGSITTDYSEALLEFVTPIHSSIDSLLKELTDIHHFTYQHMGDEKLWVNSMPCVVEGEELIPIARYGSSNVAKMKMAYRRGLGHRYGRLMQTIAGIHFNFSLGDEFWNGYLESHSPTDLLDQRSAAYFGLTRNFLRHSWLPCYLFGASPAVCKSFLRGREHNLPDHDPNSFFAPHATSLRLSDLGYSNNAQAGIQVCYNSLESYVDGLRQAIRTPHVEYQKIPSTIDGKFQQLNPNLLQIENEFYAVIRPKQVAQSGESPSRALIDRGVEYVEVRSLDLNPFNPVGITQDCIRFFDTLLVYCLLSESPQLTRDEREQTAENRQRSVMKGREPDLELDLNGRSVPLKKAGIDLIQQLEPVAALLDQAHGGNNYATALAKQTKKLHYPELTPSARILAEMEANDTGFYHFAMQQAAEHEEYFKNLKMDEGTLAQYQAEATESLIEQQRIEDSDTESFQDFLESYFQRQNA
ncbi:MAG: glutamate--cysteine ligase [Acidiferrobacterales bacterium]|nr:glutamate--cysteine ligase [Acidiferrobacterales bacterium]